MFLLCPNAITAGSVWVHLGVCMLQTHPGLNEEKHGCLGSLPFLWGPHAGAWSLKGLNIGTPPFTPSFLDSLSPQAACSSMHFFRACSLPGLNGWLKLRAVLMKPDRSQVKSSLLTHLLYGGHLNGQGVRGSGWRGLQNRCLQTHRVWHPLGN